MEKHDLKESSFPCEKTVSQFVKMLKYPKMHFKKKVYTSFQPYHKQIQGGSLFCNFPTISKDIILWNIRKSKLLFFQVHKYVSLVFSLHIYGSVFMNLFKVKSIYRLNLLKLPNII